MFIIYVKFCCSDAKGTDIVDDKALSNSIAITHYMIFTFTDLLVIKRFLVAKS